MNINSAVSFMRCITTDWNRYKMARLSDEEVDAVTRLLFEGLCELGEDPPAA
jgi:hypothetical protein